MTKTRKNYRFRDFYSMKNIGTYGIVSGGFDGNDIDSTEFIELNEENPSWIDGKQNWTPFKKTQLLQLLLNRSKITQNNGKFSSGGNQSQYFCFWWG